MSDLETPKNTELGTEEMDRAAGGTLRRKLPAEKKGYVVYKVLPGDTLEAIALAHHCTVADLKAWNPKLAASETVFADEYLYIRA